jgi:SRSO17 transposase
LDERPGAVKAIGRSRTKPEIALAEIDRVMAAGVRFGCVLADAGYGLSARWSGQFRFYSVGDAATETRFSSR